MTCYEAEVESGDKERLLLAELALSAVRTVEDELGRLIEVVTAETGTPALLLGG
jgi:hypothetical protein